MDGEFTKRYQLTNIGSLEIQDERLFAQQTPDGHRTFYARRDGAVWRVGHQTAARCRYPIYGSPALDDSTRYMSGDSWTEITQTRVLENTGSPWETKFQILEPVTVTYSIADRAAEVSVPAGTFRKCLKIVSYGFANVDVGNYIGRTQIEVQETNWYAPGVGLIKVDRIERTQAEALNYGRLVMELTENRR